MADLCVIQKHEADIELIMDAVCLDNVHYCIENEDEAVAVIPFHVYEFLMDTYNEWLQEG